MNSGLVGGLSAAVFVPLIFWLLSRVRSLRVEAPPGVTLEQLTEEYKSWENRSGLLILVFVPLCCFLLYRLLLLLAGVLYGQLPHATYTLVPNGILWLLFALPLGILAAIVPMHFVMLKWLGKERYDEYTLYSNLKAANTFPMLYGSGGASGTLVGLDTGKVMRVLAAILLVVVGITLPLSLDSYTLVTPSGIVINRYFSLGESRYSWADIEQITNVISSKAPNGKAVRNPYYTIKFRNGDLWDSSRTMAEPPKEEAGSIMTYIAKQSGKQIVVDDPYPDAQPYQP